MPSFKPLKNVVVLDLSRHLPGPYASRILMQLGARVIKIEPLQGDPVRHMRSANGQSVLFDALNAGKESIALNLKESSGVAYFLELVSKADVVLESFRPGVLDRLGVGFEALRERNHKILVCSISGFGQEGPKRNAPGHDINYIARAGILEQAGNATAGPLPLGVQVADVNAGEHAAMAILACLVEDKETREGRHLDISMTRALLPMAFWGHWANGGGMFATRGTGPLAGGAPAYRVYKTQDARYMSVGALEPKFFQAFCEIAGCPELGSKGFAMGAGGEGAHKTLTELFAQRTQQQWCELLRDIPCCVEPVWAGSEAWEDADLLPHYDRVGELRVPATEFGVGADTEGDYTASALGADALAVTESLGIQSAVFQAATASGALLCHDTKASS